MWIIAIVIAGALVGSCVTEDLATLGCLTMHK